MKQGLGDRALRYWGFFCALAVGANLLAIPLVEARLLEHEPELEPHIDEGIRASYPDMLEPERRRLVWESFSRFESEALAQPREAPRSGEFVNVSENGFRLVADQGPWPPAPRNYNVFFFGGSTGFGYSVRDEDTVPSRLQQLLSVRGNKTVRVYNFAHGGYTSWQERVAFERLIALGHVPDLAVFMHGMNDFQSGPTHRFLTQAATTTLDKELRNPMRAWFEALPMVRAIPPSLRGRQSAFKPRQPGDTKKPVDDRKFDNRPRDAKVIREYLRNAKVLRAIADAHEIELALIFQPVPTYHYDLRFHALKGDFGSHTYARYGYRRMAQRVLRGDIDDGFVWCADIQLDAREPLYVDSVHYNPKMSRMVAQCIRDGVVDGVRPRPQVRRRTAH
ncbi:MAG: SGNH/GDSL hydrolase family protein [Myxococcota bacterium]|nr:SGNH/GDSL hydrolase family protein [Myxococcota bacterium]